MSRMRSWLYCPGDSPRKIANVGIYDADGIVLDLEDSVPAGDKDQARILVAGALEEGIFDCPCAVRINGPATPWHRDDIAAVAAAGAGILRIPKLETPGEAAGISKVLDNVENEAGLPRGSIVLQFILETPVGIENAFEIARAGGGRLRALCFGAEDYCAATGMKRPGPDYVLDYPRSRLAAAAASAGLQCYDTVWADYSDEKGLWADAMRARNLGYVGKSVIHPDQVAAVNEVFSITAGELAWAGRVLESTKDGGGAVGVDGSMVDEPVLKRARRILDQSGGSDA